MLEVVLALLILRCVGIKRIFNALLLIKVEAVDTVSSENRRTR